MAYGQVAAGMMSDERGSNLLDGGTPYYDTYRTADGEYMAVGALEPQFFAELVRVLDIPGLPGQADHDDWPKMRQMIAERFATKTRAEWTALFEGVDACVAPVLRLSEAKQHPHLLARETLVDVNGIVQPAPAPRFSRTPGAIGSPARTPGADTTAALLDWGIEAGRVESLLDAGVLSQASPPAAG
jgi:alpha-methylacyl-CoA racemase